MKSKTTKLIIWLASIMAVCFIIAALIMVFGNGFSLNRQIVDQSESFDAAGIEELEVQTTSTKINVLESDSDQIKAVYHGQHSSTINRGEPQLVTYQSKDKLVIRIEQPRGIYFGINIEDTVLDVYVPAKNFKSITVTSTSGACVIEQLNTESFIYKNVSGSLKAKGIYARDINLASTSGSIELEDYEGDVNARSISGRVILQGGSSNENLVVDTTSGQIKIYQEQVSNMDIKSVSGQVEVKMNQEAQFSVKIATISGKIENMYPVTVISMDNWGLEGVAGSDEASIKINTTSGKIILGY
ncbi:MAG: DUF4097 family beta strand repeat-containing protein [Actinomycetota bacterium]|jgi:lia operon protein LiaG|nr:DUF4097 family beta strand repeat-containing protein [Actinomycetota bacterium]